MEAEKQPDYLLHRLLGEGPRVGGLYRHYKTGGLYRVELSAIGEASQAVMVVYRSLATGVAFVRPLAEWQAAVEYGGRRIRRFQEVDEAGLTEAKL